MVLLGSSSVSGSEAVWIMERPWVGEEIPPADYNGALMFSAYASSAGGKEVPYNASNSNNWTMVNASQTVGLFL
jgi:hypothetical protein